MVRWGQVGLCDGFSMFMEGLVQFYDYVVSLSLFIFWFVVVLVALECWGGGYGGDRDVSGVFVLEFVWTLLPMILLVLMAYPSLVLLYMSEVSVVPDMVVVVTGHQWYWEYEGLGEGSDSYLDGTLGYRLLDVDNRLVLPSFQMVGVEVTSADVIHSWAVPSLGVKMDCIPGRINQLMVEVLGAGVFYGQCSELCGVMHSFMPIVIEVVV